jgi:hypothetical protein
MKQERILIILSGMKMEHPFEDMLYDLWKQDIMTES